MPPRPPQGRKRFQKGASWVPQGGPWGPTGGIFEVFCRKRCKLRIELASARELYFGGFGTPRGATFVFWGLRWSLGRVPGGSRGRVRCQNGPPKCPQGPPGGQTSGFLREPISALCPYGSQIAPGGDFGGHFGAPGCHFNVFF